MTRVYVSDGTGITFEAVAAVYIGDYVELDGDGLMKRGTADSKLGIGVVSGSSYKGVLKSDGSARTANKIEIGEKAAVRCVGEVELKAMSGHAIVPGCRLIATANGEVDKWENTDEAQQIVGTAVSAVFDDEDDVAKVKAILR